MHLQGFARQQPGVAEVGVAAGEVDLPGAGGDEVDPRPAELLLRRFDRRRFAGQQRGAELQP